MVDSNFQLINFSLYQSVPGENTITEPGPRPLLFQDGPCSYFQEQIFVYLYFIGSFGMDASRKSAFGIFV